MNKKKNYFYILGVESSCDDVAIGLIDSNGEILANIRHRPWEMTNFYGGVVPELAARSHLDVITEVFHRTIQRAKIAIEEISVVGATVGPGLSRALSVGANFAKALAISLNSVFVPIHHLEGHIFAENMQFPSLVLLVSGGHTQIIYCESFGNYKIIVSSIDDAVGEVFDKIGRLCGFSFPGGPDVEKAALESDSHKILTIPMRGRMVFSFSGLKTALMNLLTETNDINLVCKVLQNTVAAVLIEKLKLAQEQYGLLPIVAAGGVLSNRFIRSELQKNFQCFFPAIELCTDNGVMVARAALEHCRHNTRFVDNYNIDIFPSMSLEEYFRNN